MKKLYSLAMALLTFAIIPCTFADNTLNGFAFNLFHQVEQDQNIVISPYSLSSLLAILANGAAGNTQTQLLKILNLNAQDLQNINAQADKLTNGSSNFLIANALWGDSSLTYKKSFTDLISHYKSNHFYTVDFIHKAHDAVNKINNWVNTNTHGYISQIITDGNITPQTRLILTNAIYFKGSWELSFDKTDTQPKPFTLVDGSKVQVPMMMQRDSFLYMENPQLQALLMTYNSSTLALAVLLPKTGHPLKEIQNSLNPSAFSQLLNATQKQEVIVSLPKFKLASTFDDLPQALQSLGLTDAFTDKANFSNMSVSSIYISDIIQKALIQVDEEGTVAAAATSVMLGAVMSPAPKAPAIFNANHPFFFILYDMPSQTILFMGQVIDPNKS